MADALTGPVWDAIRAAGITVEQAADGWRYQVTLKGGGALRGGGAATAEAALEAALHQLVGIANHNQTRPSITQRT